MVHSSDEQLAPAMALLTVVLMASQKGIHSAFPKEKMRVVLSG